MVKGHADTWNEVGESHSAVFCNCVKEGMSYGPTTCVFKGCNKLDIAL
jgi:hypothetical protein